MRRIPLGVVVPDPLQSDQRLWIGNGQRLSERRVHQTEDRVVRTQAKC